MSDKKCPSCKSNLAMYIDETVPPTDVEIGFICGCGFRVTGCKLPHEQAKKVANIACGVVDTVNRIKEIGDGNHSNHRE